MAEAFLSVMLEKLNSLIQDQIGLIMGVDEDMTKLASILTTIQAVLEDAEQKQLESHAIRNWLIKLNDLTYEIDDILDECATHVSKWKLCKKSRLNPSSLKKILFRYKIGRRMKQVAEKLDGVAAERKNFHLSETDFVRPSKMLAGARETGPTLNDVDHVYGREAEKDEIVDILVNRVKDNQDISILPIVGLGGLGKTTLAQLVFREPRVTEHLDVKIWVCVSDNFDLKTLIKAVIESATKRSTASDLEQLGALEHHLWDLLNQKRCLLVLDDVWNDVQEKWSKLRNVLTCGSPGSSIIVTTRQRKVAEIMGTLQARNLKGLSDEHCWSLLKQCAFGQGEEGKFPKLEAIGEQIVKKCAGVPLAAKALGGLLRFHRTEKEWTRVKESELGDLPGEESLILPALRLSYHHLPWALRQCFAYCAIFPKDSWIHKETLIRLWMAHGYISSNGTMEVEDVGERTWNELILRSFFQNAIHDDGTTSTIYVTMHDLFHDLAASIMENKVPGTQLGMISTSTSKSKIREANISKCQVAFPNGMQLEMDISSVLASHTRLRVLEARLAQLPPKVRKLKHLRFLNLSSSDIQSLPDSLCNLWNLEILDLTWCLNLVNFPKNMRNLQNLRHLVLKNCYSLVETPFRVGEITCLKTLEKFIVGCNNGYQLEELQHLNLGGKLEIQHLERVKDPKDARKANLAEKHNLCDLSLMWDGVVAYELRGQIDEKVLEALEPNPNIGSLEISSFSGRHFPNWMKILNMKKLVRVEIVHCKNLLELFQSEQLPHLKELTLGWLRAVEYIVKGECVGNIKFPSLQKLELYSLPNLKGFFQEEAPEICPNLETLNVSDCPSSVMAQLLSQLNRLKKLTCDDSNLCSTLFRKLNNLEHLTIRINENMTTSIPVELLECLINLKKLGIWCAHDRCVPLEGLGRLHALQVLKIWGSDTLTCLPKGWLSHNKRLERLEIRQCKEFVELPEEIRYLDTLSSIILCLLPKITSLPDWLGDLTSLRHLGIYRCPKLTSLPSCIQGMTNLESLCIGDCPSISRRCEEGKGEDWHQIAHIPYRDIRD